MANQKSSNESKALAPFGLVPPVKRPVGNAPLLQWFNGLPAGKYLATGWHIQTNRCSEELTTALKSIQAERLTVLHKMTGEMVEYWSLGTCSLIVLCNGFQDSWAMKESAERDGIAYGWIEEKSKSKVKARVFVHELAIAGYLEPFIVTLEGMITEEFLSALEHQFAVLDTYEKLYGHAAPFYGFSLELAPAEKPKMVGNNGRQSPIVPMVAIVPQVIDDEYLSSHLCPAGLLQAIIDRDLVGKAIQWSIDVSRRIVQGEDRESWETPEYDAALHPESEAEELATKEQIKSINNLYRLLNREAPAVEELQAMSHDEAAQKIKTLSAEFAATKRGKK